MSTQSPKRIIAITGGIGSGKSTVARIIKAMGYDVYDCDSRARCLMDTSIVIKQQLSQLISPEVISPDGNINRQLLAELVFTDNQALQVLNSIVHSSVRSDIARWAESAPEDSTLFIETAILYESRIDRLVQEVWDVTAPDSLRISRVMNRNGITAAQVQQRIDAQCSFKPEHPHPFVINFVNDGITPLLPQVLETLHSVL